MISVKNIKKQYGKGSSTFTALDNISLNIPGGVSVAITGKSGSGKSTLMHVISGLDSVSGGNIAVNGKELTELKAKEIDSFRSQDIGFIFQSFFIEANQSCLANVLIPLEIARTPKKKRIAQAEQALKAVGLSEKTNVHAGNLSGGQKQRLAIARAIVNSPKIIFADEPTGNLDSATGEIVEDLLFSLNKKLGTTLLIVTHDHDLAKKCDIQVRIKDGRITQITDPHNKLKGSK